MDDQRGADPMPEDLRREWMARGEEIERLRQELAEAKWALTRQDEASRAETLSHAGELEASAARTTTAEIDAAAAWRRAAELGVSLGRRIAEGQAQLIASQVAVTALESASEGLVAGQASIALRESEARHRLLIESWAQAVWETDADGVVVADSPSWRAYTGQTLEEWLGYGWLDAIHPDDRAYASRQWREAVAARGLVDAEFRLRAPDGGWRWTNVRAAPVPDAGGRVEKWVGMNIDIGARRRAEAALRESEERQAFQLQLSDALASLTDPADIHAEAARLLGGRLGVDRCYFNEFDDRGTHVTVWSDFHRDGLPSMVGVHDLSGERHFLDLMQSGAVLEMPDLTNSEHFSVQAKATYGALGMRSALGAPLLRNGHLAAVLLAADTRVRLWTRGDAELLSGVAERTWAAIQRARGEAALRESEARTGEELEARVRERTAELMAAEESLRQSQKMEAIGQLTGGIAHDFNNMLQGVSGALAMAQRRLSEGRVPDVTRYMQAAGDAATRAAGLTRRLLAFARRQRLDPRSVDVDALIGGIGDLLRRTMGPSITLDLQLCDGAGQILCDPSELESAVLNLCINARDAMPQGGRLTIATTDVRLAAADIAPHEGAAAGDYVSIRIKDTGTGMTPEVLEHVLEPFFTTKPQGEGTGLGLSQVHGFVRQSGGVLRIASAPGRGTTMRILLPLTPAEALLADRGGHAQAAVQRSRGETVLMVDDEAAVRGPAAEYLRDLGYRVVEANDGPTALRLLDEGLRPNVLVTDVGMPNGMDGRAVTEEAQRRLPGLPVIFVTGYARVTLPDDAVVVTKPFDLDLLARRLGFVFGHRP
ncbi:ATP-binding protein [Falsiroseomonas sp. E2-1-a20]|uniref:ATP-binding protein n=1 Tax=Falsiroseomonas sp. E2-1-a20 TaxID=3239300 RepID=UPI003F361F1C